MNLFQLGDFTLRSGQTSQWRIECDALTADDWVALAKMAAEILPPFWQVYGVPRGGVPFADALARYRVPDVSAPTLIAEDVVTTGGSMERYVAELKAQPGMSGREFIGVCVFARQPTWPSWVKPLFAFNPNVLPLESVQ